MHDHSTAHSQQAVHPPMTITEDDIPYAQDIREIELLSEEESDPSEGEELCINFVCDLNVPPELFIVMPQNKHEATDRGLYSRLCGI